MGGATRGRGRRDPEPRRHPDLRVPGRRGPRVLRHVALRGQPARRSTRRPVPADRRRRPSAHEVDGDHRRRARRGPDAARRGRGEGGPRQLRHPGRADARGARREAAIAAAREHRLSRSCSSCGRATITHKTDVGGVQARTWPTRRRSRRAFDDIRRRRRGARAGDGHFLGVTVQPMIDRSDGLRADPRQQRRSAVRPGAAVRRGRRAGRGVPGPGAGAAAADDHAGAADDGARRGSTRRCGACAGGRRSTSTALEQLLVRFSQLVVEQRRDREIDINPLLATPSGVVALDARVVLHDPARRRRGAAAAGHPPLPDASTSGR